MSGGGGGGASPANHYITTQSDSDLSNEFNLGSLSSGILKHAVSGGVSTPATATIASDYSITVPLLVPVTGRYYSNPYAGSLSTTAITANTLYLIPFPVVKTITVIAMGIEVTSGSASTNARLGIYNPDANGWPAGAPLLDAGTVSTASNGVKEITSLSQALPAASFPYWLAMLSDGTATIRTDSSAIRFGLGCSSTSTAQANALAIGSTSYGSLPTISGPTWTDLVSGANFRVWIRV